MKKLFTFAMALCASAMMFAENRTVSIDCVTAFQGKGAENPGAAVTYTQDGVTFTCDYAYGDGKYGIRCFKGSTISISAGKENIVKITFEFPTVGGKYYDGGLDPLQCVGASTWTSGALASQARLNGNIVIELGEGTCEPPTPEEITVAEALEIGGELGEGEKTTDKYVVKGYVTTAYEWDTQYNNQTFYISDDPQDEQAADMLCKYSTGDEVKEGDYVAVTGKIEKYVKESKTTVQFIRPEVEVLSTDVENVFETTKVIKFVENGQVVIIRNGVKYNTVGAVIE